MSRRGPRQPHAGTPGEESPQVLFSELDRRAFRIAELEDENKRLKHQLAAVSSVEDGQPTAGPTGEADRLHTGVDETLENDQGTLQERYDDLLRRFSDLNRTHQGCDAAIQRALRKYEASKKVIKEWKAYIDRQPTTRKDALQVIASPQKDGTLAPRDQDTTPRPIHRSPIETTLTANMQRLDQGNPWDLPSHPSSRTSRSRDRHSPTRSSSQTKRITSGQTTDDARSTAEDLAVDDQDEVQVVREVNLKRKRSDSTVAMPPPRRIKEEPVSQERPGSAQRPLELRSDDFSSPVARRHMAMRTETSDLDAMIAGRALSVPVLEQHDTARAKSEEACHFHLKRKPRLGRHQSSLSDGDVAEVEQQADTEHAAPHVRGPTDGHSRRSAGSGAWTKLHGMPHGALRQLSPNVQSSPRKKTGISREAEGDADKVAIVSEDGDEGTSQSAQKSNHDANHSAKSMASRRLDALLEKPTPTKQALQQKPTSGPRTLPRKSNAVKSGREHLRAVATPVPGSRTLPRPTKVTKPDYDQSKAGSLTTPASHGNFRTIKPEKLMRPPGSPPPVRPEDEPLRCRRPETLRLEDFRLNPKYAGSDFAFADSIRGRDARKCLPGCTKPECCGQFLEMARMGVLPATDKSDNEVLEDFLGPNFRDITAAYAPAKRKEMLLQARAQEAANGFGKHRQAFERAKSPPGYWRTDMPSTQEEQEYRKKAWEMERQKVEDRWREAMRPNGQWLFRDE